MLVYQCSCTRFSWRLVTLFLFCGMTCETLLAQETRRSSADLEKWFKKFPDADSNKDGKLTESEAKAFQKLRKEKSPVRNPDPSSNTKPTSTDVPYGEHPRQKLDLWLANSERPTPILIYFHGGAFKGGDKSKIESRSTLQECLKAGISVISANYRFSSDGPFPVPMHDGARVVQFVRSKASEWNIDGDRIALGGSSAGAMMALWIALHDDLANPKADDPIERNSTRVRCVASHNGTASVEPDYIKKQTGVTELRGAIFQLFGVRTQAEFEETAIQSLVREASPLTHVDSEDPPLFLTYAGNPEEAPFPEDSTLGVWIHHVSLGIPLKEKYDRLKIPYEFHYQANRPNANSEIEFLKRELFR